MKGDAVEAAEQAGVSPAAQGVSPPAKYYLTEYEIRWHTAIFLIAMVIAGLALALFVAKVSAVWPLYKERELLLVVLLAGIVGGLIHSATSFTTFAGNRELVRSWLPWFYLRAAVGMLLAAVVYLAIRAEIFGAIDLTKRVGLFRVVFLCAISGLFSKQVTDKLSDLVSSLFALANPPKRADALQHTQTGDGGVPAGLEAKEFAELIRSIQERLIQLGHLNALKNGKPAADGILEDETRAAIERFFVAAGVSPADRAAAMGPESAPDYWTSLLRRLEETK